MSILKKKKNCIRNGIKFWNWHYLNPFGQDYPRKRKVEENLSTYCRKVINKINSQKKTQLDEK